MNVNLYDVISSVGNKKEISVSISDMNVEYLGESISVTGKQPFTLMIECVAKDIVRIECDPIVHTVRLCSRCLSDVECDHHIYINRRINVSTGEAYIDDTSETDEISYIEDCNLDIDKLILDELFTVLPMNILCKEDCKGICKVCGINLNKSLCDCDQSVPDPRMAVFSDIFKQFDQ